MYNMVDILIIITGFTIFSLIVLAFGLLLYWTYKELNKYKQVGRGLGITEGRIKSGQPKIYDYDVTKIKTMHPPPPKAINKTLNV